MARAAAKRLYEPSWKTLPAGCAKDACAGYEERISHLIAAGNLGLMLAADRCDPDRGVCFSTAAKYSIRKEIWTEAGFDMSVVTRPCPERYLFDVSLTATDDRGQIDIAEKLPLKSRKLCPNADQGDDDGPLTGEETSLLVEYSRGIARLGDATEVTPEAAAAARQERDWLSGHLDDLSDMLDAGADQILDPRAAYIFRARYLTSQKPVKLKPLAGEYGISLERIHQIAEEAKQQIVDAFETAEATGRKDSKLFELARVYGRRPPWWNIEDWLDRTETALPHSTPAERAAAHRMAEDAGACDFHLNRVPPSNRCQTYRL
jgi:hypothetical protein